MNCLRCKNSIYDAVWGEFKCKIKKRRIYPGALENICSDYDEGDSSESATNKEYHLKMEDDE